MFLFTFTYIDQHREFGGFSTNAKFFITNNKLIFLSHREKTQERVMKSNNLSAFIKETDECADKGKTYKSLGH